MWRTLFLAIGISLCILGGETLVVDKLVLADKTDVQAENDYSDFDLYDVTPNKRKTIVPPEWAPWSLLSAGAVVILYAMTMRGGGN